MVESDITKKKNELDLNRNSRNMDKVAIDKELTFSRPLDVAVRPTSRSRLWSFV